MLYVAYSNSRRRTTANPKTMWLAARIILAVDSKHVPDLAWIVKAIKRDHRRSCLSAPASKRALDIHPALSIVCQLEVRTVYYTPHRYQLIWPINKLSYFCTSMA